ncbi:MAG TPA: peptidoglycan DD-metalloendopeptidase family protein [Actinomycetota bacterium]|nr:peptidoglycan DD-metalloendopeptidase family protein [Actinomycetota bacterium]
MKLRSGRSWIAVTFVATLVVPAVMASAASKQDRLDKVQDQRQELQQKIDVDQAKASELRANARELNSEIIDLRDKVTVLTDRVDEITAEVRSVQDRIDATQAEIDRIESIATQQAVMLYKTGDTDTIDALLSSTSLAELNDRITLLGVAASQNTDALVRYGRLRLEIQDEHRVLFDRQKALEAARDDEAQALAQLDVRYDALAANLHELEVRLGREHAEEEILADQENKLKTAILAAQVGRAVAARGVSTQGFIWPLNGAITSPYGPRWGRMHTGIDIDGVTGDPIVASKAGRVIVAGYYGGYGNAVVIDHGGGVATLYGHQSRIAVHVGDDVSQGQVIGYVGCTGSCTGDHLHFEVRINGNPVDPMPYLP